MRDAGEMDDMGDAVKQCRPIGALREVAHGDRLDPACGSDG